MDRTSRRFALAVSCGIVASGLACGGTDATSPTAPADSGPILVSRNLPATALAGTWEGTYPDGRPIVYVFVATGLQEVNWRTGSLAWAYNATYSIAGGDPVPFPADFEPPVAYWGATSTGTLKNKTEMVAQSAEVAAFRLRRLRSP